MVWVGYTDFGANVTDAQLEGGMAIEAVQAVEGAVTRFRQACQMAEEASGTDPSIRNWDLFEADEANFMINAMGYSEALGENVVDAAGSIGDADQQGAAEFRDVNVPGASIF
jgi:hypothetical protein